MVYEWTQLGVREITNLFLYGTQAAGQEYSKDDSLTPAWITNGG